MATALFAKENIKKQLNSGCLFVWEAGTGAMRSGIPGKTNATCTHIDILPQHLCYNTLARALVCVCVFVCMCMRVCLCVLCVCLRV